MAHMTLSEALSRPDGHGLSVRIVPYGKRMVMMKVTSLHRIAPDAFNGRAAQIFCLKDGGRRVGDLIGCFVIAPAYSIRQGIQDEYTLQLFEPHEVEKLGFQGWCSKAKEIWISLESERICRIQNACFRGS